MINRALVVEVVFRPAMNSNSHLEICINIRSETSRALHRANMPPSSDKRLFLCCHLTHDRCPSLSSRTELATKKKKQYYAPSREATRNRAVQEKEVGHAAAAWCAGGKEGESVGQLITHRVSTKTNPKSACLTQPFATPLLPAQGPGQPNLSAGAGPLDLPSPWAARQAGRRAIVK